MHCVKRYKCGANVLQLCYHNMAKKFLRMKFIKGELMRQRKMTVLTKVKKDPKLYFILTFGFLLRLIFIGNIPGNRALYVDELFSGYESYSLLKFGYDYLGYHFPVYLPVWGGGMSVMQALCQMPFIAVFGLNSFALRLPAALLGCVTLYAFYYICKKAYGEDFALFATFILSVMPWHIMQSRWGLDCNYFVGFITISIALLITSAENNRYLPVAALFMGLTLYTYALPWAVMPLFALLSYGYLVSFKRISFNRYFVLSVLIILALSFPLILFVLVNFGYMHEIRTQLISIPKLSHFRSGEITLSVRTMMKNFYDTLTLFINQDDGRVSDVTPLFGLYYKFSNVFIVIGIFTGGILELAKSIKEREARYSFFVLDLFICSLLLGSLTEIFFSRINIIHIPLTYYLASGLWYLIKHFKNHSKEIVVFVYGVSCLAFMIYYVTYHDDNVAKAYGDGAKAAIEFANDLVRGNEKPKETIIHCLSGVSFTQVLFYNEYPTDKYIEEVEYADLDATGGSRIPLAFGRYDFENQVLEKKVASLSSGDIYICSTTDYDCLEMLKDGGFNMEYLSYCVVAY